MKMTSETMVKVGSIAYFIAGLIFFILKKDLFAIINFSLGFVIVFLNFAYLERLIINMISENKNKALPIILINLIRYPLIAIVVYAIIQWKNFKLIPFLAGITALVFGLFLSPLSGGIKKNGS